MKGNDDMIDGMVTEHAIFKVIGLKTALFRPPFGVTTPSLGEACQKLNYIVIGWNLRSFDTRSESEDKIFQRISRQLKPGSVLLLHDSSSKTVRILRRTLELAQANQLRIVPLQTLWNIQPYRD